LTDDHRIHEIHFIEEMGHMFSRMGTTPMVGRLVGFLMVCTPEAQNAKQLGEGIEASTGAISTAIRQLIQMGMAERVTVRGSRAAHYKLRSTAWSTSTKMQLAWMPLMMEIADRGLALMADKPPEASERLLHFKDFYRFLGERLPALVDEWEALRSS